MSQPQPCLVFDLDGTLVDTDRIHLEAFNRMLAPFGRHVTADEYKTKVMGFPNTTIMPHLLPDFDAAEHERLAHHKLPEGLLVLDELPLTAMQKLDRRLLARLVDPTRASDDGI